MTRVAVVRGGRSLERDISLRSGHHVAQALRHASYEVMEVDVDADLAGHLESVDAAFIALHGRDGEDGTVQLVCEALGVAYTGSPPLAARVCFDKGLAKGMLRRAGLRTPEGHVLTSDAVRSMGAGAAVRSAAARLGFPLVVKPAAQGSALGLAVVGSAGELSPAVMGALNYGDRVLLEEFVDGDEFAVPVAGPRLEPLPAVDIKTRTGVFDFEARVSPGAVELRCPSRTAGEEAARLATEAARAVGLRDFGRVDMRQTDDGPTLLDVKTCPGLTETSILPLAVAASGRSFEGFVVGIVESALSRKPRATTRPAQ